MTTPTRTTGASHPTRPRFPIGSEPHEAFTLTLWTDDPGLAARADAAEVDRIGVDLERRGKRERQRGLGTWISDHTVESLVAIGGVLTRANLFARIDPWNAGTPDQVEALLALGTQVLMLPMFERADEVATLIELVAERAQVVPLLETRAAVAGVEELTRVDGLQEVHIGLNDLALSLGVRNRFEILASELLERVCTTVRRAGLRLGIGAIGRLDDLGLPIPADLVYSRYARLGASAALIARSFTPAQASSAELARQLDASRARLRWWGERDEETGIAAERALRRAIAHAQRW
jgi:HpcH/HpaI aldolase/citrate lyase family